MSGFRKKLFIWTSGIATLILLLGALVQLWAYVLNISHGNEAYTAHDVFSEWILMALVAMAGISGTLYGAARAMPGSPEYTDPSLRSIDPTLNAGPPIGPMTTTPQQGVQHGPAAGK